MLNYQSHICVKAPVGNLIGLHYSCISFSELSISPNSTVINGQSTNKQQMQHFAWKANSANHRIRMQHNVSNKPTYRCSMEACAIQHVISMSVPRLEL